MKTSNFLLKKLIVHDEKTNFVIKFLVFSFFVAIIETKYTENLDMVNNNKCNLYLKLMCAQSINISKANR